MVWGRDGRGRAGPKDHAREDNKEDAVSVTVLLWILWFVVVIVLLDLGGRPLRRLLDALTGGLARLMCALRRQAGRMRDAVVRWHRVHLARLEAERLHVAVHALERRYASLVGHDLAQFPRLRQEAHETLHALEETYNRDEVRLSEEPAWVSRLEALASTPAGDSPQGRRLAQDIHETVLRITRMGMEEQHQMAKSVVEARRRLERPLNELIGRLEQLHEQLDDLHRQGERLDHALERYEEREHPVWRQLPAYAQAGTQWLLGAAGLALVALAVVVYHQLFGPLFTYQFPTPLETPVGVAQMPDLILGLLLGVAAVCGWLLAEARGVSRLLPEALLESGGRAPAVIAGLAATLLAAIVLLSAASGFHLEWLAYRNELLESVLAGEASAPPLLQPVEQSLAAALGLMVPLVVALAPVWLVSVLQSTRIMLGAALAVVLALVAGLIHLLAVVALQLHRLAPAVLDLLTFAPRALRERFA